MNKSQIVAANRRGAAVQRSGPRVTAVDYDPRNGRIVLHLSNRLALSFLPGDVQGLEHATPRDLRNAEISPAGLGVHFPSLDADIYVPALCQGLTGSKSWMAAQLGRKGGSATTRAKKAASRANGKLGGRPRKVRA